MSRFSQSDSQPTQLHKGLFTPSWLWGNQQCHGVTWIECITSSACVCRKNTERQEARREIEGKQETKKFTKHLTQINVSTIIPSACWSSITCLCHSPLGFSENALPLSLTTPLIRPAVNARQDMQGWKIFLSYSLLWGCVSGCFGGGGFIE